jgi:hypothetical protein
MYVFAITWFPARSARRATFAFASSQSTVEGHDDALIDGWRCGIALVLVIVSSAAAGDDGLPRHTRVHGDRLMITIGASLVDLDSNVAARRTLGAIIDLEDLLGFDQEITSVGLSSFWRLTKSGRQRLSFTIADYGRSASAVVSGTVPGIRHRNLRQPEIEVREPVSLVDVPIQPGQQRYKTEAGLSAG